MIFNISVDFLVFKVESFMKNNEDEANVLKNQVRKLNLELDKKNKEINGYLEKINNFEEELIELHEFLSKTPSQENIQKAIESEFKFELKEKEREIRELKNSMGFLRKEKIAIQRELEEIKKTRISSVISIEDIREKEKLTKDLLNFETLTTDLQKKLHRQEVLIGILKKQIGTKNEQIEKLNLILKELNQELELKNALEDGKANKFIIEELNKGLQKKLNKYKKKIENLKKELTKYKKPEKEKIKDDIEILELKKKIINLQKELERKDKIIKELTSQKLYF